MTPTYRLGLSRSGWGPRYMYFFFNKLPGDCDAIKVWESLAQLSSWSSLRKTNQPTHQPNKQIKPSKRRQWLPTAYPSLSVFKARRNHAPVYSSDSPPTPPQHGPYAESGLLVSSHVCSSLLRLLTCSSCFLCLRRSAFSTSTKHCARLELGDFWGIKITWLGAMSHFR